MFVYLCSTLWLSSCQEPANEIFIENNNPPIVIDASISNKPGPYFVQVSKAANRILSGWWSSDNQEQVVFDPEYKPVTNATITLSDDQGNSEVLVPYTELYPRVDYQKQQKPFASYGFYQTLGQIQGIPGRTYTLTVQYEGKSYKAVTTLPEAPDFQVSFEDQSPLPLVSFDQSNTTNNYMFFYDLIHKQEIENNSTESSRFHSNLWTQFTSDYQMFDARRLTFPVKNLSVYKNDRFKYLYNPYYNYPEQVFIEMHQVSRETYEFYQALENLNSSTGGVFSTTPATPPSNFDNGALGFFKAASIKQLKVQIKK